MTSKTPFLDFGLLFFRVALWPRMRKIALSRRRQFTWCIFLQTEDIHDILTGKYVLKNCVSDQKHVSVFSLHAMQYPVIL